MGPELAGIRVDTLLKRRLGLSGTVVRRIKWLPDGILVDGSSGSTPGTSPGGEVLSVRLSDPERRSGIMPAPGPLDIIYEDPDLLVLNKAPGVVVHPGPGHYDDTIGNFLLYYYDSKGRGGISTRSTAWTGDLRPDGGGPPPPRPGGPEGQLHTADFCRTYLAV